jgi:nicotinamide riboside transporter PnuC
MMVNAGLWTALFFHMGLPMLAWLQIAILCFSVYGAIQWALVRFDIGFRLDRRSDVVGAVLATVLFGYSVVAYIGMDGYAFTGWWWVELGSVVTAIVAMWMDAYRYKANWIMWTASNCFSAPLFLALASWGPFYTIFLYQALNVVGYIRWRREEKTLRRDGRVAAPALAEAPA